MVTGGYVDGGDVLPKELRPGQSLRVYIPFEAVNSIANPVPRRLIRAVFIDQLGRRYYGDYIVAALVTRTGGGWQLETPRSPRLLKRLWARVVR